MIRIAAVFACCLSLAACQGSPVGDALAGPTVLAERDDAYCKSIGANHGTAIYTQCRMFATEQRTAGHRAAFANSAAGLRQVSQNAAIQNAAARPVNCTSTGFGNTVRTNCY